MPRSVYMPHQNQTYIYDKNDDLVSVLPGQQNQDTINSEVKSKDSLKGPKGGGAARGQNTKDILVDLASQIPFMAIPGSSNIAKVGRPAASMLSGLVADQVGNKVIGGDKSFGDSMMDAGINTGVSTVVNQAPDILAGLAKGTSFKASGSWLPGMFKGLLGVLKGEPIIPEVSQAAPVVRGPSGKWQSNKAAFEAWQDYQRKKTILDRITNALGFGANVGIDLSNNQQ